MDKNNLNNQILTSIKTKDISQLQRLVLGYCALINPENIYNILHFGHGMLTQINLIDNEYVY